MDIGAFVLGILFGWLVEWLYVTFFRGKGTNSLGDCSAYENELKTRNEEIKTLKASIASNSSGTNSGVSLMSGSNRVTAKTNNKANSTSSKSKSSIKAKSATGKAKAKTQSVGSKASAATNKTKNTAKKSTNSTTKKPTVAANKTASVKKPASATKKLAPTKKAASKGTATKKKSSTKKIVLKDNIKINNPSGDDLTKLSGIGPSMAETMHELGITSFSKLAAMDDDILRDMLEASGARLNNNKDAMDSWNEQATLADKGDFVGLKKLQEALKK